MKKIVFTFILSVMFSTSTFCQIIWQKAGKGMTVAQVKKNFPKAQIVQPTDGTTLGDGAVRLLELSDYDINNFKFDAFFYFKDAKLIQVTLKAKDSENQALVYKKMVETFRMKYGEETSTNNMSIGQEKLWMTKDRTQITVSLMGGDMNIYYSARIENELNKI
ncbi:hypothetical protein C7G98_05265 [Acinetobacter baumannii]|uniref:hypothetical protein n=1 Tax=Acinetobacter baumannii TaxID=470 RepID=UPI000D0B16DD|nr:hypothetical protein [Acinetobacter baumannii]MDH2580729.1 hypothetical protein [Acinetobacter baumannii]PSE11644.1 hypothetical protein C7G98_05265 [Acinetobacter baumannii]